jgi:hypothetical protein
VESDDPPAGSVAPVGVAGGTVVVEAGGDGAGLPGGGGALPTGVLPRDTLISGVPGEEVLGSDTLIKGALGEVPVGEEVLGRDTLTMDVCSRDTLIRGLPTEEVVGALDVSSAWALAYPATKSAAHRPTSSATVSPATFDRNVLVVAIAFPVWDMRSPTNLRKTNNGASWFGAQLDLIYKAGHQGKPSTALKLRGGFQGGHCECPTVTDGERQAINVRDETQVDQSLGISGAVPDRVGDRLVDSKDELVGAISIQAERRRGFPSVLACRAQFRATSGKA